jgi:flagellin-like protein
MKFTKNDEAVSPVIGVILMVAITVILAAVIAAFVFGMAGNISKTKVVAATAQQQGTTIFVTYQGGQDHSTLAGLTYKIGTGAATAFPSTAVGTTVTGVGTAGQDHVVITASFTDGSSQVVLDSYV